MNGYTFSYFFSCDGRACRREFLLAHLLPLITIVLLFSYWGFPWSELLNFSNPKPPQMPETNWTPIAILLGCLFLAALYSYCTFTIRRFHDIHLSGWWFLLFYFFRPFVWGALLLIPGTAGENSYGAPPRSSTEGS